MLAAVLLVGASNALPHAFAILVAGEYMYWLEYWLE